MKKPALRLALVLTSLVATRALAAQEVPTFHAGQWGAEFTGGNWGNAGVMRFFSPRSALVLSASGSYSRNTSTPDGGTAATSSVRALSLALGVRGHGVPSARRSDAHAVASCHSDWIRFPSAVVTAVCASASSI